MKRMTEMGPNGYFVRLIKNGENANRINLVSDESVCEELLVDPLNEAGGTVPVPVLRMEGYIVDRLAAYENLNMEPEIIAEMQDDALAMNKDLRRWRQLESDGLLVVLPSKTVFELTWDAGPGCDLACPVTIDGEGQCDFCDHGKLYAYEVQCRQEHIERIGKDVFLNEEDAKAALEAANGET